ncbi:MAG: O-antigen ligase family protein [Thermodesulfovibrio sp.]|nr:O-antigen ligase family protein [Thermodesulfovibrio sp.]
MRRENYLELVDNFQINAVKIFLYIFIFLQPFNYFNTLKEISFYCLLFFFIWKKLKEKNFNADLKDITIISFAILILWILIVSILGPYPLDSLNAIRKNLFIQVILFFVIYTEFKDIKELKPLFFCIVVSFFVVSLFSLFERDLSDFINYHQIEKKHKSFIGGYANNATFYLPFTIACLISFKHSKIVKYLAIIAISLEIFLVLIYNSRTAIIAIPLGILSMFLISKRYKLLFITILISVLCFSAIFLSKSEKFSKYKTLFSVKTYVTNQGLSNRLGVWSGALDVIKERPLVGYGYGWKKMAWVIKNSELVEYWKEKRPDAYKYYVIEAKLSYGRVNPHNLIIQILFEIGLIGLILFLIFWFTIIFKIFKVAFFYPKFKSEEKIFLQCSIGVIISYALINITNGFWHESYGNMIFTFLASCVVIYKKIYYEEKNYLK